MKVNPVFWENGEGFDNAALWEVLGGLPEGAGLQATTPHGSYTFDVVGVEYDTETDTVTLRLKEQT